MADSKLSALTEVTSLTDADEVYINDDGTSKRITALNLRTEMQGELFHVRDEQADGTNGGSVTGGTRHTRVLNTSVTNEITGASLASNQITLPSGTYEITASAPARGVNNHRLFWVDTAGPTDIILGANSLDRNNVDVEGRAHLFGRFTIGSSTIYELQHVMLTSRATVGLGSHDGATDGVEVFAEVIIRKIG